MKIALTITGLIALSTAIGSFTWIPGAVEGTRNYMIEPAIELIKDQGSAQRVMMAGMKLYDVRTDELAEDVKELSDAIDDLERELQETLNISPAHKRSIQRQIKSYKKKLYRKARMLDRAKATDQKILAELSGQVV